MAGLVPAIHALVEVSNQRFVKVIPAWIHGVDETDFPGARPMLDSFLALDCVADVVELFVVNEPLQAVTLTEATNRAFSMFEGAAR
jgi:hypothetical protein